MMDLKIAFLIAAAAGVGTPLLARAVAFAAADVTAGSLVQRRNATIEDLASKLEQRYVFPDVARRYAAMLRANAAAGAYGIADDKAFGQKVTEDLEAVAFDGHLKLVVAAKPPGGQSGHTVAGAKALPDTIEAKARLTKDIAYIRLGKFFNEAEQTAAIKKFIQDNADVKTMIFDVRTHVGGGLEEMDVIFPYLFDKETVLVGMDTRSSIDRSQNESPRLRRLAVAPDGIVRREHFVVPAEGSPLAKAKIFVLSSGRTGSAGEHFVLSLKRTGRATVIGETTYGAGNYGGTGPIEGGFQAFIAVGRTFDPDTGKGWDYTGIAPHIAVPAATALIEALVRSGVPKAEAESLSARYGPTAEAVMSRRKAPASIAGI